MFRSELDPLFHDNTIYTWSYLKAENPYVERNKVILVGASQEFYRYSFTKLYKHLLNWQF